MDHTNGDVGDVAAAPSPQGEALEFVRFCHRRKRVGWPELYDEMCAVAGRGLYQGYGSEELAAIGIGFGLFQMPALANLVGRVVAEDQERRRRAAEAVKPSVVLTSRARRPDESTENDAEVGSADAPTLPARTSTPEGRLSPEPPERAPEHGSIRIAVAAGA
jgi:hypothetical protein